MAAVGLLASGLFFVRAKIFELLLSESRSITAALVAQQPSEDIRQRLAGVAVQAHHPEALEFGGAPYSGQALYFQRGVSMIRIGTSNGIATDFDLRKIEYK